MARYGVNREPCASCPYRMDTPSGVWSEEEYRKLPKYDEEGIDAILHGGLGIFMCHQPAEQAETLCRGWLTVHSESLAVRLGVLRDQIDPEDVYRPVNAMLYADGQEACEAGLEDIESPSEAASHFVEKILRQRGES